MASIFLKAKSNLFTVYRAEIQFRKWVMGGTPKDPRIIENWLKSKAGIEQEKLRQAVVVRTLIENGADIGLTPDQARDLDPEKFQEILDKSAIQVAAERQTNGFKRLLDGAPYLESRIVKAAIKENISILYPNVAWGARAATEDKKVRDYKGKAARSLAAERVFVDPDAISLGVTAPSGIELFIGHVIGPQGPRSNLTYVEYVEKARISFVVRVAEDTVPQDAWERVWAQCEENGLGAMRSQGFGRFDTLAWDKIGYDEFDAATRYAQERHLLDHANTVHPTYTNGGMIGKSLDPGITGSGVGLDSSTPVGRLVGAALSSNGEKVEAN